ncbi:hypothetical protein SPHFLASMR4Y_03151 [Sphingorhabdus sp. SMR4y]|nr:hypothetical protein SPHFLASMR4Y_03151 [Sphingorhabdus sp. SMR4y]
MPEKSSNSGRNPLRVMEADPLLATTAGAPLRAMAGLAVIWIMVRALSWYGSAHIVSRPPGREAVSAVQQAGEIAKSPAFARSLTSSTDNQLQEKQGPGLRSVSMVQDDASGVSTAANMATLVPDRLFWRWQDPEDVRRFFLQTSVARTGTGFRVRLSKDPPILIPPVPDHPDRIAAYFWIFARQNSGAARAFQSDGGQSIANGQYGGSQAGAILSYRLLDRRLPEMSLYGRFSAALDPWSEQEMAMGTRIRPVQDLPFALHAEQRFDIGRGNASGTAFFVTGGNGPDRVAEEFVLETYAQGGYILGPHETYFFDGAATLQRPIATLGVAKLSLGPGAWAGGQRNVHRLDVGPRIDLAVPVGTLSARLALDWRTRVAGNARPGSGATITFSSGF